MREGVLQQVVHILSTPSSPLGRSWRLVHAHAAKARHICKDGRRHMGLRWLRVPRQALAWQAVWSVGPLSTGLHVSTNLRGNVQAGSQTGWLDAWAKPWSLQDACGACAGHRHAESGCHLMLNVGQ